jgi:hypothetical protein
MGERGRLFWLLALLVLALTATGCGDDSTTGAGPEETAGEKEVLYPRIKGPGREFIVPGGDNIIQFFGEEASAAEREKANRVIHAWMKARVAEDWKTDCKYFSREYSKSLVADANGVTEGKVKNCPEALEYFGDAASGTSGNTLTGPIDSLRVRKPREGDDAELEAFAQWHGPERDWVLPLQRENGVWKVDIASPLDREK